MNTRLLFLGVLGLGVATSFTACSGASSGGDGDDDDGATPKTNQEKIEYFCDVYCKCDGACYGSGSGDDDGDGNLPIGVGDGDDDGENNCVAGLESLLESYEGCSADATADYYACLAKNVDCESVGDDGDPTSPDDPLSDPTCSDDYTTALTACQGTSSTTSGGSCTDPDFAYYCSADDYCMRTTAYCDGFSDCSDGSDEAGCPSTCAGDYPYDCGNNYCVSASAVCNGVSECPDGRDELGCPCLEAQCNDGTCIPQSYVCDAYEDCASGEDELSCAPPECESGYVQCADGACIPESYVCDGSIDCSGGEDEDPDLCP